MMTLAQTGLGDRAELIGNPMVRARQLGERLRDLDADPANHRLSRAAWERLCLALGGFADLDALLDAQTRIVRSCPFLASEIAIRADIWRRNGQDRPAPWAGFGPHGDATSYAERLAANLSVEEVSAVAAYRCAAMLPPEAFGKLNDLGDLATKRQPLLDELIELDAELGDAVRIRDLRWQGGKPMVGGVELTEVTCHRLASAIAEQTRLTAREDREAA